ncbi:hypothetical protein D3C78_647870 [compost metagenome]
MYHLFFKVLGIFLMLVELTWFIGLPVGKECREWWQRRDQAHPGKTWLSGGALLVALLLLALPWRSAVEVPAVLEAAHASALHAPLPARLKHLHVQDGQTVAQGALLLELESPDLDARQGIVRREIEILQLQLRRQAGRSETAADVGILEQRLAEAVAEYRGLAAQRQRLQLRAAQAGTVRDVAPDLHAGRWLSPQTPLLRVVEPGLRLRGYLAEEQLWRVAPGAAGRFVADDPARAALRVQLSEVDATGASHLEQEALASDRDGPIAVRRDEQRRAVPVQGQYGVHLQLREEPSAPAQPLRGVVVLEGEGESPLGFAWRRLAALGVRESGF